MCIATSCCLSQNACVNDTNMSVVDDAGTMEPAGVVYLACVYVEVTTLQVSNPGAGLTANLTTSEMDCSGPDGGNFPAVSLALGNTLAQCIAVSCPSVCGL